MVREIEQNKAKIHNLSIKAMEMQVKLQRKLTEDVQSSRFATKAIAKAAVANANLAAKKAYGNKDSSKTTPA